MPLNRGAEEKFDQLRKKAESLVHQSPDQAGGSLPDILEVIHELQIHQAELSIQNAEIRRAQQELSDLQQEYENLYEFAPCGYVTLDAKRIISRVNISGTKLLGAARYFLVGTSLSNYIDSSFHEEYLSALQKAIMMDSPRSIEVRIKSRTGMPLWVRAEIEAVLDAKGEVKQWRVVLVDITAAKSAESALRAEAVLRESEKRFRELFEHAPLAYQALDAQGNITAVNATWLSLLGYRQQEVIGRSFSAFLHPAAKSRYERHFIPDKIAEDILGAEFVLRQKGGADFPISLFARIGRDEGGAVAHVLGLFWDITERKQAEAELRNAQSYISNIIESMPSILIGVDRNGKVNQWNGKAQQATGIPARYAKGKKLGQAFPRLASETDRVREAMETGQVSTKSLQPWTEDGATRFNDVTIFPLEADGVQGAVIRVDDVTERVRIEEMMIQNEKMLSIGGLAAGMAHEINNPLAGILQSTEVLINRLSDDLPANLKAAEAAGTTMASIRQYMERRRLPYLLDDIRVSGNSAAVIVRNMLSFARRSERTVTHQKLGDLLDQTLDLLKTDYNIRQHYDFKHVHIVREYDVTAGPVPCQASKLQQVFVNILKNSAEAMAAAGGASAKAILVLRVLNDGAYVRVEIEDNGPGMDEKTSRRIFEPFFTTKPPDKGTGLGLSVSYFIVTEDHGGEISVHTVREGGSCFVIRLPKTSKGCPK